MARTLFHPYFLLELMFAAENKGLPMLLVYFVKEFSCHKLFTKIAKERHSRKKQPLQTRLMMTFMFQL